MRQSVLYPVKQYRTTTRRLNPHYMTHNTRELEDMNQIKAALWQLGHTEKDAGHIITMIESMLHHQLQKARQTWLREEIVKLGRWLEKGTHMVDCPISHIHLEVSSCTCGAFNGGKNHALQTIIDRYQAELDQDKV